MDWLPSFGYDELLLGGLATLLVLIAGLMSGLTLGLMSLDHVDMELLKRTGTEREKRLAERITPIISNPHYLLVTLLLINAVAMEALPLVLDTLADPVTAVITSVTVVLLFGEIVPQAVCSRCATSATTHAPWCTPAQQWTCDPCQLRAAHACRWRLLHSTPAPAWRLHRPSASSLSDRCN